MYIHKLNLTNVRGLRVAEFDFLGQAGVHLIVGVNGVGKSTTLDALRILLSQLLPQFVVTGVRGFSFDKDDITHDEQYLGAQLTGQVLHYPFRYAIDRKVDTSVPEKGPVQGDRIKAILTPDVANLYLEPLLGPTISQRPSGRSAAIDEQGSRLNEVRQHPRDGLSNPLAVYYSAHRSLTTNESATVGRTQLPAYVEALNEKREFSNKGFAEWWRYRQELAAERSDTTSIDELSAVFNEVVTTFLPRFESILLDPDSSLPQLALVKNGYQLSIRQLSDGERNILTLALDLARRLYLANPHLPNPTKQAQAIVLIDELDLHLHPGWQRDVVKRLETTFPKCQFIASTHSAQVIGEVLHNRVTWILPGEQPFKRPQSYGLETGWIIEFLMGVPNRNLNVKKTLDAADENLAARDFPAARQAIKTARELMNGSDGELTELEAATESLEDLYDDAEDN